jgi:mRNA-degrading endonuclease toxin of MazEF toxin-antitoxin module
MLAQVATEQIAVRLPQELAAPITRTVRDITTEVRLGSDDGMSSDCAASFDDLRVLPKAYPMGRICALDSIRMVEACHALRATVDY